jgi:hypothetical protein
MFTRVIKETHRVTHCVLHGADWGLRSHKAPLIGATTPNDVDTEFYNDNMPMYSPAAAEGL